ncbi:MAG: ureidomalonase, partial [Pseudonocardiales bacterium]|nr:ureidomalonase [Pseudonocardiales bacterium]
MTELPDLDALELGRLIARGAASSVEVVAAHLDRIDALNPRVNAIVAPRDRDAVIAEAAARDTEEPRGPLHGLPIAVKDLTEVAGLPWAAGSPVFRDRVGAVDEPVVGRLRAAGLVIVGKTNTPELGFGSQTYNPVYGVTRNPYDLARTIGGSSGGAAAALAARMLPVADGSDYMGSLRNPAAFGNVLGFRPTAGTVAPHGPVVQLGELGPMGRTVDDVAALLSVMADPGRHPAGSLDGDVRGTRVAWVGDLGGYLAVEPGVLELGRGAATVLAELGCVVDELAPSFDFPELWQAFLVWRGWNALELAPLHADPALRAQLKPEIVWEIERGLELSALDVSRAVAVRQRWIDAVAALFQRYDAVLAPSTQVFPFPVTTPWPEAIDGRRMDTYHRWMETVMPWSMAGVPALGMPAGFTPDGLPVGVQLIGPPSGDRR